MDDTTSIEKDAALATFKECQVDKRESLEVYNIYLGCCEERRLCGRSWLCTGQWAPVKRHGKIMTIKRSGKYLSAMWTSLKSGFGTALGSVINLLWFKMSLSKRTKHLL